MLYGTPARPRLRTLGHPRVITVAAGNMLLEWLQKECWAYQDEMRHFLWEECGISCSNSTISRFLERNEQSYKVGQKISDRQNPGLRLAWKADMLGLRAEQLVFIDKSLFNSTTGWRKKAWSAIGQPARYHYDISRGKSWSILPAYTVDGYLPCTGIKEGYFNADEFYDWICNSLLPV